MSDIYRITITTQDNETYVGLMTRRQPEIVNGFVALAMENGDWMYFSQGEVKQFHFELISEYGESALMGGGSSEKAK